jgi:hypothetical protein
MTFAKPEKKQESSFDEEQRLMCSVPGCNKRWTVHISGDRPKCSHHQWSGEKPSRNPASLLPKEPKTVAQWYDDKEDF